MPVFEQRVSGQMRVRVEAKDMYEADEKIANLTGPELEEAAIDIEWTNWDTDEFPYEV